MLDETAFADDFVKNAVPLDTEEGYVNAKASCANLTSRVYYPAVDHLLFSAETGYDAAQEEEDDLDPDDPIWQNSGPKRSGGGSQLSYKREEELQKEAMFKLNSAFLSGVVTHLVFCQNPHVRSTPFGHLCRALTILPHFPNTDAAKAQIRN
jgi:hypothetical protein